MSESPISPRAAALGSCTTAEDFDRIAREAAAEVDAAAAPAAARLACREGCSLCCQSLRVDVFAQEVFLIARHLRARLSEAEIAVLLARLDAHAETVLALTPFEHATSNIPCPLLHENRCSVYAVRPHSCRRHHSLDFAACQFTYDHPMDLEAPAAHDRPLFRQITELMITNIEAYAEAGFDYTIYELGTALREALQNNETWDRWTSHREAFLQASITPAE